MTVNGKPAPQKSLDAKEWQVDGIAQALDEAEKPDAVFIDHAEVLAKWESKKRCTVMGFDRGSECGNHCGNG